MGIEILVIGFKNGARAGIPPTEVLALFGKTEADNEEGWYALNYDSLNSCDLSMRLENGIVSSLCISRPCAHAKLYESLFKLLSSGPYVAFAPGGPMVIADLGIVDHLPKDMIESLGPPVNVLDERELSTKLFK